MDDRKQSLLLALRQARAAIQALALSLDAAIDVVSEPPPIKPPPSEPPREKRSQIAPQVSWITNALAVRDYITTEEFATVINRSRQTIRKNYCYTGHYLGIRPRKIGGRLMWPLADIAALLAKH